MSKSSPYKTGLNLFGETTAKTKKKKRGWLGNVVHVGGKIAGDLKTAAVNSPGGVYEVGKAVVNPVVQDIKHGPSSPQAKKARKHLDEMATSFVTQPIEDFKHPLRRPGDTLLSGIGLATLGGGTVARVAAGAKAAKAAEEASIAGKAAKAAEAVVRKPKPAPRVIRYQGNEVVGGSYSKTAITRGAQKLADKAREAFPEKPVLGRAQVSRMGRATAQQRKLEEGLGRVDAAALRKEGKKLSAGEQQAIRVQAEGVPVAQRIAYHQKQLETLTNPKLIRQTKKTIVELQAARQHLSPDGLTIASPALKNVYESAKTVARQREQALIDAGVLDPETAIGRVHSPAQVISGARYVFDPKELARKGIKPDQIEAMNSGRVVPGAIVHAADRDNYGKVVSVNGDGAKVHFVSPEGGEATVTLPLGQLTAKTGGVIRNDAGEIVRLDKIRKVLIGPNGEDASALAQVGDFRVPFATKAPKGALNQIAGSGTGNMVGRAQKPGSLTHTFEGKILAGGGGRNDVTTLLAESNIEAQRFTNLVRARKQIVEYAHDNPEAVPEKYRVAVNVEAINGKHTLVPQAVRDILDKADSGAQLSKSEIEALGASYDAIRSEVFPSHIPAQQVAGFKWIDSRMLGDLHKQNPLAGFARHGSLRVGLNTFDQINSAQKFAILYLKPAYAVPNMLGNAALALIQQGFAAPRNLTQAARLNSRLGVKAARAVDEVMGEGVTSALGHDPGFLKKLTNNAAHVFGTVVDVPFRRSSFLHEARLQGYKTPAQINKLLFDESKRADLLAVAQRANSEMIDYGRLGPVEKSIVTRAVFFYPWVKGATIYGARMIGEHPIKAAVLAQLGQIGKEAQQRALGGVPSYYEGLIRTGGTDALPRVINPTSATIFQTPADVASMLASLVGQGKAEGPQGSATPALGALLTLLTGVNSLGYNPSGESNAKTAGKNLYEGLPLYQLQKRLRGQQTSKTSTYSERDALLKWLLGITPYTVDRARLNSQADR